MTTSSRPNSKSALVVPLLVVFLAGWSLLPASTQAIAISADFREELNFYPPDCDVARVMQALGRAIGPGVELGEADEIANPCGYGDSFLVDYDPSTNQVILTPSSGNNYPIIDIFITNLVFDAGETITGLTPVSDNIIDVAGSGPFTRTTSFTGDSITISYVVDDPPPTGDSLEFSTGSAVFQVQLGPAVPTLGPIAVALLLIGLLGLGLVMSRRLHHHRL